MEKLLELLSEYDKYRWEKGRVYWWTKWKVELDVKMIISKKFWFIKWLVENDKIDKKKIDTRLVRNVESHYDEEWYWVENSYEDYSDTDTLLMILSISDTPIEDLISYLR